MIHREGNYTWNRSLEKVPYLIFFVGMSILVSIFGSEYLMFAITGGVFWLLFVLVVIPNYASKATSLGIFGSPCRWGFHSNTIIQEHKMICTRCDEITRLG